MFLCCVVETFKTMRLTDETWPVDLFFQSRCVKDKESLSFPLLFAIFLPSTFMLSADCCSIIAGMFYVRAAAGLDF